MDKEIMKYLYDIKVSIDSIEEYLGEQREFGVYLNNKMLRRAVERGLEIIGEVMTKIERLDPSISISNKKRIISMRNRVIHGYDKIDDEIVWGTIIRHLPILKREVDDLMNQ